MPLSPLQLVTLRALVDRLIPADEFPGAVAAGTDAYVLRFLEPTPDSTTTAALSQGLLLLDAEAAARHGHTATFSALPPPDQDALLAALEENRPAVPWPASLSAAIFFNRFIDLAHEGFYADPANGGNRSATSWHMLGYNPRLPGSPISDVGEVPSPRDDSTAADASA